MSALAAGDNGVVTRSAGGRAAFMQSGAVMTTGTKGHDVRPRPRLAESFNPQNAGHRPSGDINLAE